MSKPEKTGNVRPATREEILRESILLHEFAIFDQGQQIAEGYIVQVLNVDVVMVDVMYADQEETVRTYYLTLTEMTWNFLTRTGFQFGPRHNPQE
jgi:hypothetical protein